jgi:hypothetical protein
MTTRKPGLPHTRKAQRLLHAAVSKPVKKKPQVVADWLNRIIGLVLRKVLGRG